MKDSKLFWNKRAKRFSESSNNESNKLVKKAQKYLSKELQVLDFGCGTGGSTYAIAPHVNHVTGVDFSDEMIFYASQKKARINNVSFKATSIDDKQFNRASYDVIFAFNVLHLVDDLKAVSQRVDQLLKPGGVFISSTPCIGEKKNFATLLIRGISKLGLFPVVSTFSSNGMESIICENSFDLIEKHLSSEVVPNSYLVFKKL